STTFYFRKVDDACVIFLSCGVKEIIISLGKDGSIGFTSKSCIRCQCEDLMVVNATGAGDAFMGAYVYSSLLGFDLENKMKFSSAASVCTIEHEASVCDKLSFDFINQRMKQLEFDIKEEKRCI
ncbi:MAG: PfkB family carbohydrate kinase, partial [Traorella sp.]